MLEETAKALAKGKNFAVLATLLPSGQPQAQVVWLDADDDYVLIGTDTRRQKFRNIERDPRVTVTIIDAENPYHYAEVRGRVVDMIKGPEAQSSVDELSHKYLGHPFSGEAIGEFVILKIESDRSWIQ
jgi:PPOX class probable F420-dependent enzyme